MHDSDRFLETLMLVLCTSAATTVLFHWLRQPVVLGYLIAGMVVGPYVPIPFEADIEVVRTLSHLGVILLMYSLGIEFSLPKLMRVGVTAGVVAVVQCSLMLWIGYLIGQAFGWSRLASVYAGAVIAISSTTIIVKALEEQKIKERYTQIVFGILIVEDLIAILLLTILAPLGGGEALSAFEVLTTLGRLFFFLALVTAVGLWIVPRMMRAIVGFDRAETTVVASVGFAFGMAYLAEHYGYSIALGAFLAGSLVAESGVERKIEHLVQPVRDVFAAIFFVSVGILIDPRQIVEHWPLVLTFLSAVVFGKILAVTFGCLLTGRSVQTAVKCGMCLAQIGEFSFIIAGVGLATKATDPLLSSIAVAVSGMTTLLTPWLIRAAADTAGYVDRKLPRRLQTFLGLYGSWVEQLSKGSSNEHRRRAQRLGRWLAVDTVFLAVIVVGASLQMSRLSLLLRDYVAVSQRAAEVLVALGAIVVASPFWIGLVRMARALGFEIAYLAFPPGGTPQLDYAAAPRKLLVVTVQLVIVILLGLPLVAITQPFLPPLQGAVIWLLLVALLAISFWRGAANFQGHAKAAAQLIAEALARQTRDERASHVARNPLEEVNQIMTGLGSSIPLKLQAGSAAVGKTLAEVGLRGRTGATVVAIQRNGEAIVVPAGGETLRAGDLLAIAGTEEALDAAQRLLEPSEESPAATTPQ